MGNPLLLIGGGLCFGASMLIWKVICLIAGAIYGVLPKGMQQSLSAAIGSPCAGKKPALVVIPFSHYVEKVRWVLDKSAQSEKNYTEITSAPLLHIFNSLWYSGGKTTMVPQLIKQDGSVLQESSRILNYLYEKGDQWIYPNDESRTLEAYFDKELGPQVRRWVYFNGLLHPKQVNVFKSVFKRNVPDIQSRVMDVIFPVVKALMTKALNLSKGPALRSRDKLDAVWKRVEEMLADGRKYLAKTDAPSAADVAFAALAYPAIWPEAMAAVTSQLPAADDLNREYVEWVMAKRASPAGQFILKLYADFRGTESVQVRRA